MAFQTVTPAQRTVRCEEGGQLGDGKMTPGKRLTGSGDLKGKSLGNGSEVTSEGNGVLLEGSIDRVARGLRVGASRLLALAADLTVQARVGEPLDSDGVSDLERSGSVVGDGDDTTSSLVASDKGKLGRSRPVSLERVQVGVADSRVLLVSRRMSSDVQTELQAVRNGIHLDMNERLSGLEILLLDNGVVLDELWEMY
jgi:hypothetical protein